MLPNVLKAGLVCAVASFAATSAQATTAQFLTRLYTEGLGRAPDTAAWKANTLFNATPANCTSLNFSTLISNVYTSAEYNSLAYTSKEKVLTLYRGILSREPDDATTIQYWASLLDSGTPITTLINNFTTTSEFTTLRDTKICTAIPAGKNTVYTWGTQPAIPLDVGSTPMAATTLQNLIDDATKVGANKIVSLPQGTVVYADRKITIPAGVTLTTAGNITRSQYAKMARIVRTANFDEPTIVVEGSDNVSNAGGVLNTIWVAGQRGQTVNGVAIGYRQLSATVLISSKNNVSVINNRLDSPVGGTNIGIDGSEPTGFACKAITVSNNFLTAYSNTHYGNASVPYPFSDGITSKCGDTTITNNTVLDSSDVSIILFYTAGAQTVQASTVSGNLIISSGVPAFAAMMYEPYYYAGSTAVVRDFTGSSFTNNTFFAAEGTRFEIGFSAGRRPWSNAGYSTSYINGGKFSSNKNDGINTSMQIGVGVGYALNTTVSGNTFNYLAYTVSQNTDPYSRCPSKGAFIIDNIDAYTQSHISGNSSTPVAGNLACGF